MAVQPSEASLVAGETLQLTAVVRDSTGAVVEGAPVIWLAAPFDVAAVDAEGRLTGLRQGRAQVFAMLGGSPGVATIEVTPKPPVDMETSVERPEIVVDGFTVVHALPRTVDREPRRDVPVTFRSLDGSILSVDEGGIVRGLREGTGRIEARAGEARGVAEVRVVSRPFPSLHVGPLTSPIRTGDVVHLRAEGRDGEGGRWEDPPVRWSVNGPGAEVHPDGAFVAEEPGSYLVTATAGDLSASTPVRVAPRVHGRRLETVDHHPFPDLQVTEHWAIGDALYVGTIGDRVYVFDISNPGSPVLVDSVMVDAHVINDVSTNADGTIGVMTREGASSRRNGLVFLDLSDPLHPSVLSEYTATVTGGVHSAYVDGHHVYATDDATGSLRVISFEDPESPREVARWEVEEDVLVPVDIPQLGVRMMGGRMLHDVQVKDGLAYLAYWRHGVVILDVGAGIRGGSPEDPKLVSRHVYNVADYYPPDHIAGTHAVFRSGDYLFVADEVFPPVYDLTSRERIETLGRVHVLDVRDVARPVKVAEYNVRDMGSHNLWVEDDVMYIGYYEGGVRAVDVSGELRGDLMAQGREIDAAWTGSSRGFRPNVPMAWGAQPHRGHVYATDMNSGVWVLRLTRPPLP